MEVVLALVIVAAIVVGYGYTWLHSQRISQAAGRPPGMRLVFAVASVLFMPITLLYWATRRLVLGA